MSHTDGNTFTERFEQRKKKAKQRLHEELDSVLDGLFDFFQDEFNLKLNHFFSSNTINSLSVPSSSGQSSKINTPEKRSQISDIANSLTSKLLDTAKKNFTDDKTLHQLKQEYELIENMQLDVDSIKKEIVSDSDVENDLTEMRPEKQLNSTSFDEDSNMFADSETECECSDCADDDILNKNEELSEEGKNTEQVASTLAQSINSCKKRKNLCKRRAPKSNEENDLAIKKIRILFPKESDAVHNIGKENNVSSTITPSVSCDPKKFPSLIKCLHTDKKCPMFKTKFALFRHLLETHRPIPWQCLAEKCSESFEDKDKLFNHALSAHADVTKWQCSECSMLFDQFDRFHQHAMLDCSPLLMRHYGERIIDHYILLNQFICPEQQCSKVYTTNGTLKKHKRTFHGINVPKSKPGRKKKVISNGISTLTQATHLSPKKANIDNAEQSSLSSENLDFFNTDSEDTKTVLDFVEVVLKVDDSCSQQLNAGSEESYNQPEPSTSRSTSANSTKIQAIQPRAVTMLAVPALNCNTSRLTKPQSIKPLEAACPSVPAIAPSVGNVIPKISSRFKCPEPGCRSTDTYFKAKSALYMHLLSAHNMDSQKAMLHTK